MTDQADPRDPGPAGTSPIVVRVTVEPGSRGGGRHRRTRLVGLASVALALCAVTIISFLAGGTSKRTEPRYDDPATLVRNAGEVGVAAAYQYPLACLRVTIATADSAYAAARLNRVSPCWRFGTYTTVIFHRVMGVWRMALQTTGPTCELSSIPGVVRAQLGLSMPRACSPSRPG